MMRWTFREELQCLAERFMVWRYPTRVEKRRREWERRYLGRVAWLDTFTPLERWHLRVAPIWTKGVLALLDRPALYGLCQSHDSHGQVVGP